MQSKSDAIIVIPTMLNQIKAFHIFQNLWIIADSCHLYQMSKNASKIHKRLEIQDTINIYETSGFLIIQSKEGWITLVNTQFAIEMKFHLNIFSFCKLGVKDDSIYSINANQLEARNILDQDVHFYNYQSEIFCSSIKVLYHQNNQFIILTLDNGIIDILENEVKKYSYTLTIDKQNPIFVYDCCAQFENDQLIIMAATNQHKIFILKQNTPQQVITLTFCPTSILFYDTSKLNPLIALNKDKIALVNNKEICKFSFTNIVNYYYSNYFYLCTNEQIVIIDFNYLKK